MSILKKAGKPGEKPLIRKPYLKGRAVSALALRRGLRVLGYLLLSMLLFLFLGQLLVIETAWLRWMANLAVLFSFAGLLFSAGSRDGESDVSFAEIALSRQQEGKTITQEELDRCFHPLKGYVSVLLGALPAVLICLAFAFIAVREHYMLGSLPSWLAGYESRADISLALAYYKDRVPFGVADALRLVVRLMVFPFINLAGTRNADGILLVERLSPLLVLIAPMFYGVGYHRGEHYRAMVHGGIATNAKRAARKKKKQQQQRRQEPRQLV